MPVNPNIFQALEIPKFATLGEIAEAREQREDRSEQRRYVALKRQQEEDALRQKQMEEQAVTQAFQRFTTDDGPDYDAIVTHLERTGQVNAAGTIRAAVNKQKRDTAEMQKIELDNDVTRRSDVAQLLQGVNERTYGLVFPMLAKMDPEAAQALTPQYDPDAIGAFVARGTKQSEWNARVKAILEEEKDELGQVLGVLALAESPEQWQGGWDMAKVYGVGQKARQMGLTPAFAPEQAARAGQLAIDPTKRAEMSATAASQAASRDVTIRGQELSAATARRGQDLSAATQRRGQDLTDARAAQTDAATGGAKLSAAAVEKVASVDQSLGMLDDVERLLPSMMGFIGPVDGRVARAKLATGAGVSPELAEFDAQITGLKNAVIKATTGAAMSEPEAKRIMGQLPDLNLPEAVFKARLATTRRNLDMLKRRTIELSGGTVAPATATAPSTPGKQKIGRFEVEVTP